MQAHEVNENQPFSVVYTLLSIPISTKTFTLFSTKEGVPLNITNIFQNLKDVTLHVPKGTRELYMKAENWKDLIVVED